MTSFRPLGVAGGVGLARLAFVRVWLARLVGAALPRVIATARWVWFGLVGAVGGRGSGWLARAAGVVIVWSARLVGVVRAWLRGRQVS